jgi:asparagine synthase (glutamine-hydrolysing)
MCGITGIMAFNLIGNINKINITAATMAISKRGPDFQDVYFDENVGLGHRRLSIIDTTSIANQPMWDENKRYCIVFNGEIFNYRELREELESHGAKFFSHSDTEVLLKLFIRHRKDALQKVNGFFAFCIYDKIEQSFFVARDRFGVKPLLFAFDDDKFLFASEMKSILAYGIEKTIDFESLYGYLQLNYIPAPHTIFKTVKKLLPGHFITVQRRDLKIERWYDIPYESEKAEANSLSYPDAKVQFHELLEASVKRRLVADVPLGSFLSGGIDSSVIAALAKRHKPDLHTFSIGFRDEKFFDETEYANLVAKHIQSEHTVFSLTNDDLYKHIHDILNYIDEPFADSSAINVYILSKETRKHATVALSGDGADELLGGYNKHAAFQRLIRKGWKEQLVPGLLPLLKSLPQSRNNSFSNKVRQLVRFADGAKLNSKERYWRWAGYANEDQAMNLFNTETKEKFTRREYHSRKDDLLRIIPQNYTMNDILRSDMNMVLPNDMLMKVDLMSMAHGLEIRTPFLDYQLVNFLFSLPSDFKINKNMRKRILQDTFRDILPSQLYNRPKKGFEVPLLKWLRTEMKALIADDLLSTKFIEEQGIFHVPEIEKLKLQLFSSNPGDVHARIWSLIVFQWWWKRYMSTTK